MEDLSALMVLAEPERFEWRMMFRKDSKKAVIQLKGWSKKYLVRRRKDVLSQQLPPKVVQQLVVSQRGVDMQVYNALEKKLRNILKRFTELMRYDEESRELDGIFRAMMSVMQFNEGFRRSFYLPRRT